MFACPRRGRKAGFKHSVATKEKMKSARARNTLKKAGERLKKVYDYKTPNEFIKEFLVDQVGPRRAQGGHQGRGRPAPVRRPLGAQQGVSSFTSASQPSRKHTRAESPWRSTAPMLSTASPAAGCWTASASGPHGSSRAPTVGSGKPRSTIGGTTPQTTPSTSAPAAAWTRGARSRPSRPLAGLKLPRRHHGPCPTGAHGRSHAARS